MKKYFALLLPCAGVALLLFAPREAVFAGAEALRFCVESIVPALLPFAVFSSLAVSLGLSGICGKAFGGVTGKVFGVSGECAPALLLGLISGFPVGAKTAAELYEKGQISKRDAETVLAYCNNAGPAFVIGTVGGVISGDIRAGWLLFAAQTAAALVIGVIFGLPHRKQRDEDNKVYPSSMGKPLIPSLVSSVCSSATTLLYVCAFIVFFSVVSEMLMICGIIPLAVKALTFTGVAEADITALLRGLIEFSTGIKSSTGSPVIIALILGWSGVAVHCQVAAAVIQSGLSVKRYMLGKALCAPLSAVFTMILFTLVK